MRESRSSILKKEFLTSMKNSFHSHARETQPFRYPKRFRQQVGQMKAHTYLSKTESPQLPSEFPSQPSNTGSLLWTVTSYAADCELYRLKTNMYLANRAIGHRHLVP